MGSDLNLSIKINNDFSIQIDFLDFPIEINFQDDINLDISIEN